MSEVTEQSNPHPSPIANRISNALPAIVPFFAYVLAHLFELGYIAYFQIPSRLVTVGFPDLIGKTAIITLAVFILYIPVSIADFAYKNLPTRGQRVLRVIAYWLLAPTIVLYLTQPRIDIQIIFTVLVIGLTTSITETVWNRWVSPNSGSNGFFASLDQTLGVANVAVLTLMLFACGFAFIFGSVEAQRTQRFVVVNTEPEMAILRSYGSQAVAVPFDQSNQTFIPEYHIVTLGDDPSLFYRREHLGRLTIASP